MGRVDRVDRVDRVGRVGRVGRVDRVDSNKETIGQATKVIAFTSDEKQRTQKKKARLIGNNPVPLQSAVKTITVLLTLKEYMLLYMHY